MKQAKKAHDAHENDIKQLQKELDDVERKREEFEEMCEQESQSQGKDLSLEDGQVRNKIYFMGLGDETQGVSCITKRSIRQLIWTEKQRI